MCLFIKPYTKRIKWNKLVNNEGLNRKLVWIWNLKLIWIGNYLNGNNIHITNTINELLMKSTIYLLSTTTNKRTQIGHVSSP